MRRVHLLEKHYNHFRNAPGRVRVNKITATIPPTFITNKTKPMHIKTYKNHLLIATPSLQGDFFGKSVVYIYEHTEADGAVGFTINKPLSATLSNVLDHLKIKIKDKKIADTPVFSGGPVGPDQGFVIHDQMSLAENDDDAELTVSSTREVLSSIARGKGPDNFMVTLGYSGWEPGMLEAEIQQNDWLVLPLKKEIVFKEPISTRWATCGKLLGVDMNKLSSHIGHA
ncbi:MAG: YqgE/AlgH family protein [Gammaproteobacteria bacterium]|nr:YqgE/AlgH family protein [Gammaproteobacteria bacterium]